MKKRLIDISVAFMFGLSVLLFFGYSRDWTESTPTDATVANLIDDYNRYVRVDVAERLEDYIGGFNASDTNEGFYHILYIEKSATPSTPATGKGMTYGKAVGGKCELFWIDEDGDEKQITSDGVLKISAGDFDANSIDEDDIELDNNSYLMAMNNAGDGDVNLIKAGTNDLATLPDGAEMASNAAPTEDEGIVNKKYVDDQFPDDDAFGSWASKSNNTVYQAETDGLVVAYGAFTVAALTGKTDASSSPTTTRQSIGIPGSNDSGCIMFPVKKDHYWKTETTGTVHSISVYWLPIGG